MPMQPSIDLLTAIQVEAACALFKTVFGVPVTPETWHWKYCQGPRLGSVNVVAHTADGALLGHAGAIVFPGRQAGNDLPMAQVCDIMVAPDARSALEAGNSYRRLMQTLQQELAWRFSGVYAYGFAGVRPFALGQRMRLYREVQQCREIPLTTPPDLPLPRLWHIAPADWSAVPTIDATWHALQSQLSYPKVARTAAYLRWRYQQHPAHTYRLWTVRHLLQPRGWLVTRQMPDGRICIVDTLIPTQASMLHIGHALRHTLARETGNTGLQLYGWQLPAAQLPATEPVIALEVRVTTWARHPPQPVFHPGDSDVY